MASDLWQGNVPDDGREPPVIDTSVPHVARVYDYWLDGKNNYAVDRETGDEAIHGYPDMRCSHRTSGWMSCSGLANLAAWPGVRRSGLPERLVSGCRGHHGSFVARKWRVCNFNLTDP